MKCDKEMAEYLLDAQSRFDSLHPECKHKQKLKRCLTMLFHHETHESVVEKIMTPTQRSIKCSKKTVALSNLLMSPQPPPDDHIPVKPASSIETEETIDDSDSDTDNIEDLDSEFVMFFSDIKKTMAMTLHTNIFLEIDGTYDHNIEIPLNFTHGAEQESICNVNKYNQKGPVVTSNALNHFKDSLEA